MGESTPLLKDQAIKQFRKRRWVTVVIIFFMAFAIGAENAVILPTAWKYLQSLGSTSELDLGILISAFNVASLISSIFFGWIVDKWMHLCKLVVFVGAIIQAIGSIMYFLGFDKWLIISGRFVCGLGSGTLTVILAELARATSNDERTKYLTLGFGCRQVGLLLGPAYNLPLHGVNTNFGNIRVNEESMPGLVFAVFWVVASVFIFFGYENIGEQYITLLRTLEAKGDSETVQLLSYPSLEDSEKRAFAEHGDPTATNNANDLYSNHVNSSDSNAGARARRPLTETRSIADDIPLPYVDDELDEEETPLVQKGSSSFRELLLDSIVVVLFMQLILFFCQYVVETIIPPTMQTNFGLGTQANSLFYLLIGCEAILSFAFVILVRKRISDRIVILAGNVLLVIGLIFHLVTAMVLKPHSENALSFFIASCTLIFLGIPMASVSSVTLGSKLIGPESQGKMQALRRVATSLGLILGPLWAGSLVHEPLPLYGVTLILVFIQLILFLLSYSRMHA
ncbi:unnamed protein product [Darwinula stevensoni]|uniref:Major facilitator superfamily (MFS) profile domain-containing protein n=1 Tax=Darwinula stevensoni TaxID=69355 RepID=A0A7R9A7C8_9CRUS|nr:unnamed protein product [Darwinula stevensoni]CAG0892726.1 unnamed protein product [Darwinula stevensoni]